MAIPKSSFVNRLLVLYGVVFILVLVVTDWTLSHFLQKRDLHELERSLTRQTLLIREIALPLLENTQRLQEQLKKITSETSVRVTVISPAGKVLADSSESLQQLPQMDNHAMRPEIAAAFKKETGMSIRYSTTLKTRMLYIATPVLDREKIVGVVRAAMPITRVDEVLASVRRPMMLAAFFGILIVLVSGMLFSNHLSKRIRRITSGAERYAREDWSEKILIDGRDELKMLANTMNQMAAALRSRIEDLEHEKGKISVILGHMNEGVIAIDPRKQCIMANPAAEKIFGFSGTSLAGKGLIEITRHPQLERIVDQALQEQKITSGQIQTSGHEKKTLHVNVIVLGPHIRNIGGILVFHDITELFRLENIRKEFVANVSHELRTPLTSIKGFVETLLGGAAKDPDASEKFLKIVAEETDRLGRLVEDILTLGEIEQGAVLMKKEKIVLSSEVSAVLAQFKPQILEKKISVQNRISEGSLRISGDRDKVRQVFVNLIGNAIKFNNPAGRITLSADQTAEGLTVTVEDTGIGIPEEARQRIFERFFRVDKARSKELGGTGLGLAIVKHIMEAHGGRASCASTVGQGSRFSVFFPFAG
jgi:two-component system phosphate regulon sensor histidine kinase PhoR